MRKTSVHSLKIYKIVATFIFKKVDFEQFGGNFGACTDEKTHFWPKKGAKARFCDPKVGRKNRVHFLKTALFWRFLAIFGQFAQIGC